MCWLCQGNPYASPSPSASPSAVVSRPEFTAGEAINWFATITIVVLVFLVGLGVFIDEPWAAVGFAVFMLPGVIGALRMRARQRRRQLTGFWGSRTAALLTGGITIIVTFVLVILAAIALLFAVCASYSFH